MPGRCNCLILCPQSRWNKLATISAGVHNHGMKIERRLSRSCAWSVRCASVGLALAFCISAFAADPSKNVVVRPATQQPVTQTVRKMCYRCRVRLRIPQPCDRLAAIPTTANAMTIYGHRPGDNKNSRRFRRLLARCNARSASVRLCFCVPGH